jgi:putative ABC transport system substrate-binding protein
VKTCVELSRRILNPKQGAIAVIVIAAMTYVAVAQAQQPKELPRLGYLTAADPASESTRVEAIRLALRDLGYIEGQNIAIEHRYAEGKVDRFPELLAELVRLKV